MGYRVIIAEKPSVGKDIARVIGANEAHMEGRTGWREGGGWKVTWAFGHLVGIKRPEEMGFSGATLPMIPERWEIAQNTRKAKDGTMKTDPDETRQLKVIKTLFEGADEIIVATDAGREGELIFRYIYEWAGCTKPFRRLWISSMTDEAIKDGLTNLRPGSDYDNLSAAAHERSRADWLLGFNASKALRLFTGTKAKVSLGRVQTPTLAMICRRFEENKDFKPAPYWTLEVTTASGGQTFTASGVMRYEDETVADRDLLTTRNAGTLVVTSVEKKKVTTRPPLLYDITTIQRAANGRHGYTAAETLAILQSLYEKKLTTYPRTDARVLSTAVAKEIGKNLKGLSAMPMYRPYLVKILESGSYKKIGNTRYTNDKAITDHYAIIPTGQGLNALPSVSETTAKVYELICRRFLAVFYPPAIFDKISLEIRLGTEMFTASFKTCVQKGYLEVMEYSFRTGKGNEETREQEEKKGAEEEGAQNAGMPAYIPALKKGDPMQCRDLEIREGETKPPKRYNSGSMILAMENAGQLIEEEELREQIRGSGIGTSATRAEILKKLFGNQYLKLNSKTQIITPTLLGEMIYDTVYCSIRSLLNPKLTASWELGLTRVAEGTVTEAEYLEKLNGFVTRNTDHVKNSSYGGALRGMFERDRQFYKTPVKNTSSRYRKRNSDNKHKEKAGKKE